MYIDVFSVQLRRGQTDEFAEGPVNKWSDILTAGSKSVISFAYKYLFGDMQSSTFSSQSKLWANWAYFLQNNKILRKFQSNTAALQKTGNPKQVWKVSFNGFKFFFKFHSHKAVKTIIFKKEFFIIHSTLL